MTDDIRICVLIPAFNEEEVIEGTIAALRQAGFTGSEVYIADDRSTDHTADLARRKAVNVFTAPVNGGKAAVQVAAINHFKLLDRYDWVIFLDADTKVDPGFLTAMVDAAIAAPDTDLFVGQVRSAKNDHIFSALRANDYAFGQEVVKKGQDNFNCIVVSPGCSSMYKAATLAALHIDGSTLAEDMDLTFQVHRRKGKISYVPSACVITQDPSTLKDYTKQVLRWSRGVWQVLLKHRVFGLTKKQPIDLYMMYTTFDCLFFNRVIMFMIALYLFPLTTVLGVMAVDFCVYGVIATIVSICIRRVDVLLKFPVHYWLSFVTLYAYYRSFIEIMVMRKHILAWNKVTRYSFDSQTVR